MSNNFIDSVTKILGVLTACFTLWIAISTQGLKEKVGRLEAQQKAMDYVQDSLKFIRDFKIQIYDDVKEAIEKKNAGLQMAAKDLVVNMLDDSVFRSALLVTLGGASNTDTSVKKEISELQKNNSKFQEEQKKYSEADRKSANSGAMIVDVYYAESTEDVSKPKAIEVKKAIDALGNYQTRLRILSTLVNSNPGYNIRSNIIRFEADESSDAQKVANAIKGIVGDVGMHTMITPSKNYISVWIVN